MTNFTTCGKIPVISDEILQRSILPEKHFTKKWNLILNADF